MLDLAGLKGAAIGRARVSSTHANFIVNEGGAIAQDIRELIDLCRSRVRERFGVTLREEIVYLGANSSRRGRRGARYGDMATLLIEGGRRLSGRIAVEGNKNAALPLLAACLLTEDECHTLPGLVTST